MISKPVDLFFGTIHVSMYLMSMKRRFFLLLMMLLPTLASCEPEKKDMTPAEIPKVPEGAEVHAVDVEVLHDGEIAVDLQQRVDPLQVLVERGHLGHVVDHAVPQGRLAIGIGQPDRLLEARSEEHTSELQSQR